MVQGFLIKCKCGYYNPSNAKFCMFCGEPLGKENKRRVAVIFDDEYVGFNLMRKLKNDSIKVEGFKTNMIMESKINQADFVVFSLDLTDSRNLSLIKGLLNHATLSKTILLSPKPLKIDAYKIGLNKVVRKISEVKQVIKKSGMDFQLPIYKKDEAEILLRSFEKNIDILDAEFSNFDNSKIYSVGLVLEEIYYSLKRSDIFLLISDYGFVIIPSNQENKSGIESLKNRIEIYLKENLPDKGILKNIKIRKFSKNDTLVLKKDVKEDLELELKLFQKEHLKLDNPYLLMLALDELGEEAAYLFFDEDYRSKIEPLLTLKIAKGIADIKKSKVSADAKKNVEERLLEVSKKISDSFDSSRERAFLNQLSEETQLLGLPEIQTNIIMLINEEAPFDRIVKEIQKDPAITSKILKFANSAFFGFKRKIKNIERAAVVLGTEEILGISLSISCLNMFSSKLTKELYKYSIATLTIAKYIEQKANISASATLAGVACSIGNMYYAQFLENEYKKVVEHIKATGEKYEKAELEFLPARAIEVAYKLSTLWSFPERISRVIKNFIYPSIVSKMDTTLHLIHASSVIARSLGYFYGGYSIEDLNYHTYTLFLKKFNLNLLALYEKNQKEIEEKIKEMLYVLS